MNYKHCPKIFFGGLVVALIVCFIGYFLRWQYAYLPACVIMLISCHVADKNYYCPHCSGKLHLKSPKPNFCPHCGEKIDW